MTCVIQNLASVCLGTLLVSVQDSLSRVSVRGTLTDPHIEIIRTQVEALNRRPGHTCARSSTTAASKTEMASSESIRGRALATVEYGSGLAQTGRHRAQGRRPPPDMRTRARAFNAPVAFPPNTLITGSVIGNRHPSRRSFCSLPHQTTQGVSGRGKQGRNVQSGPPRDNQSQRSGYQDIAWRPTLDQT